MKTNIKTNRFKVKNLDAAGAELLAMGFNFHANDDGWIEPIDCDFGEEAPTDDQLEVLYKHLADGHTIVFDFHCVDTKEDVETLCRWAVTADGRVLTAQTLMDLGLAALGT